MADSVFKGGSFSPLRADISPTAANKSAAHFALTFPAFSFSCTSANFTRTNPTPTMPNPTPHDELFKATFSIVSQAAAFLQTWLPEEIRDRLDFSTLQRDPDTYVDEQLQEHLMDMVYACGWKDGRDRIRVSFLFEHKSRVSPRLYFQLLRYLSNIYDKLSEKNEKPGPVIPVVIYHGKAKWEKRDFSTYFKLPEPSLGRFLPLFDYFFHDLRDMSDSMLVSGKAGHLLRRAFLLMKYQHRPEEFERREITRIIFIFTVEERSALSQDEMLRILKILFHYFVSAYPKKTENMVRKQLEETPEMAGILKGSIADAWIRKARKEGLEKGLEVGERKEKLIFGFEEKVVLLSRLMEKRFDVGVMADISGLPPVFVEEFAKGYNLASLQRLLQSVALARQAKEPVAAAEALRRGMKAYGLSEQAMEGYFTAV
jgi:predicted transposase/invertase (TIGR01784 family)